MGISPQIHLSYCNDVTPFKMRLNRSGKVDERASSFDSNTFSLYISITNSNYTDAISSLTSIRKNLTLVLKIQFWESFLLKILVLVFQSTKFSSTVILDLFSLFFLPIICTL